MDGNGRISRATDGSGARSRPVPRDVPRDSGHEQGAILPDLGSARRGGVDPTLAPWRRPLPSRERGERLSARAKLALAVRVWISFVRVRIRVRREPLPESVARLGPPGPSAPRRHPPARLSRAVNRSLRIGSRRPTCLVNSLVLYRLLREQGDSAELVIGLLPRGGDRTAHAWVELNGRDVGPPPGRGDHVPLARFG